MPKHSDLERESSATPSYQPRAGAQPLYSLTTFPVSLHCCSSEPQTPSSEIAQGPLLSFETTNEIISSSLLPRKSVLLLMLSTQMSKGF